MRSLQGKRLLVISSDSSDVEFIKAAKEMGIYTVCCDRYSDWTKSPAKMLADEAWNVDYTDMETVLRKCRDARIDGVIAGYGEERVLAASRISKALGAPFYATEEQVNFTRNKKLFKEACVRNGVMTPREYCKALPMSDEDLSHIKYPVIVKPSDNGGRRGISICHTKQQLLKAIPEAESYSKTGEIVVEEYLTGIELCAVYTFVNGEISLSCLNDKYVSADDTGMTKLCGFVVTPSRYYERYLKEADPGIKALLKELGADNGVANFQLIANEDGIYAFEMGYRINGNDDYKVVRRYNGIDFMKMLISYSVSGDMGESLEKDDPLFDEYFCTYVVHLKPGTVGCVEIGKLSERENIVDISFWRKPGDTVSATGTNTHKAGMIKFAARSLSEISDTVLFIHDNACITDEGGNDMRMFKFDVSRLIGAYPQMNRGGI